MKNVFGTNTKGTGEPDGKEFIARTAEGELARKQEELSEEVASYQRRAGVPVWLKIIQLIALIGGGVCILGVVKALGNDTPWETAKQNGAVWFLVAGCVGLAVALVIFILDRFFNRKVMGSGAYAEASGRMEKVNAEAREALMIPADAKNCDVLLEAYRTRAKDGKRSALSTSTYFNFATFAFREGDAICFADSTTVFKIPLERIERIVLVPKRIMFSGWNKEVPFNKGEFKQYKIRQNNYGFFVKPHLVLYIRGSEEFEIVLPPYELATIEQLTGKFAE